MEIKEGAESSWTTDDERTKECEERAKILESRICNKKHLKYVSAIKKQILKKKTALEQ